jgi:anaerobic selenocysteine-containing dehydrogenase
MSDWHPTACMLCENNCGIEVQLSNDGRHIEKIRGDEAHPASRGYLCQKASRIDHYQNSVDRVTHPLRRTADGSFERVDWDTAISEVAARFAAVRDEHGGDKIFYYGGGGQGNHLPAAYGLSTQAALGGSYRSNALAQEKTGEGWVSAAMFGAFARTGDFDNCEVAVFLGKNPWHSHGVARARVVLREIARDPKRALVVFDPRVSETAELADFHIRLKPGTDAWALAALLAIILDENLAEEAWLVEHVSNFEAVRPLFESVAIAQYCAWSGVEEAQLRALAQRLGAAQSVAWYEDLGVQMNRHSTLVSYLHRLCWLVTGSFGKAGSQFVPNALRPLMNSNPSLARKSPVAGAPLLGGMVPCNVIAEEILSDHPDRYRAMLIETANPAHSLANSAQFVAAMAKLDFTVVIDVAMSETARHADYILPAATQYEKAEATFFNFEFPHNYFHLRQPVMTPPADADVLTEAEIHARIVEALGEMPEEVAGLRKTLEQQGRAAFAEAFNQATRKNPTLMRLAPVVLYRALGPSLPPQLASAAALWSTAHYVAQREPLALRSAGLTGDGSALGDALFDRILDSPRGLTFSVDEYDVSWDRLRTADKRINARLPQLLPALDELTHGPQAVTSAEFPFVLSAGERRAYTANTIFRNADWRKKDRGGALRMSPTDAERLRLSNGDNAKLRTPSGEALVQVEISERMQPGHVSLPNGMGLDNATQAGGMDRVGAATNELTASRDRDFFAGTPWHKMVPAHIEAA